MVRTELDVAYDSLKGVVVIRDAPIAAGRLMRHLPTVRSVRSIAHGDAAM